MLSGNLGLGTDTYGLSFIVRDLLDGKFLEKEGNCKNHFCRALFWAFADVLLVYQVRRFSEKELDFARQLLDSN